MSACSNAPKDRTVHPQKGFIDLGPWEAEKNGTLMVQGEWEFYNAMLLTPDDFHCHVMPEKSGYARSFNIDSTNHTWQKENNEPGANGYATYRLKLKLNALQHPPVLAFDMQLFDYKHRLWVDGKLQSFGLRRFHKSLDDRLVPCQPVKDTIEIILQVFKSDRWSNQFKLFFRLGSPKAFLAEWERERWFRVFSSSVFLLMGCYHLILFSLRPKDRSTLYFGIYCLLWVSQADWWWILHFFPGATTHEIARIDQICYFFGCPVIFFFIRSLFPGETPKFLPGFYLVPAFILSGLQLYGNRVAYWTDFAGHAVTISTIVFALYCLTKAAFRKRQTSFLFLGSGITLMLFGGNDILYALKVIDTGWYWPWGILVFICFQAIALSLRFSKAFTTAEQLTAELSEKNIALYKMDKIKDEFLANTSHELRTPLNGIIGMTESLIAGAGGQMNRKTNACLSMIYSSSKRLAGLVNDILDFAKLKNNEIRLKKKPVDIRTLIRGVLSVTGSMAQSKNLTLSENIADTIPFVLGDENRIQQILYNLIGNAVKFTRQGEVKVGAAQKGAMVEIWICDTGIGIPEDQLDTIFKAFEQADSAPDRSYEGTGLGLSITRHLVALHGGDIRVESEPGANDYLPKPYSKEELIARVKCHLALTDAYETLIENQRLEQKIENETRQKEKAQLREEKATIEKLRYQLNPHFLMNCLASIRATVLQDTTTARKMLLSLAEFTRLTLSRGSMDLLTIAQEMEILHHYFAMEQARFDTYLTVSIDIEPEVEKVLVPALIIQPLVENAIKYGCRTSPDALEIGVAARNRPGDLILLEIFNTGNWVVPGTMAMDYSLGRGIDIVKQRLEKYYADRYTYDRWVENGRVVFKITIPRVLPELKKLYGTQSDHH